MKCFFEFLHEFRRMKRLKSDGGEVAHYKKFRLKSVQLLIPKTLNERTKYLRNELRLSQTEFGSKIGLSQKAIANIETGAISASILSR